MNKNIIISAVIIFLLALVGGTYLMMNRTQPKITNQSAQTQNPQSSGNSQNNSGTTQSTSLKNLMTSTGNQTCTYSDPETGSSGTMYINNGRMRGDFNSQIDNKTTSSHMISEGKTAYVWMDDQPSGFKVSLKSMEGLNPQVNTNAPQTVDISKEMDYQCSSWSVDASVFAVPTDKTFQDMSALIENSGRMMENQNSDGDAAESDNTAACSACDSAPPESQAQCRAFLKCD